MIYEECLTPNWLLLVHGLEENERHGWGRFYSVKKIEGGFCIYLLANYFLFPNKLASFFYFTFIALFLIIYYIERYPLPPENSHFHRRPGAYTYLQS